MRFALLTVVVVALFLSFSAVDTWAYPKNEWGGIVSTNFESLIPIGIFGQLAQAQFLSGVGGYVRLEWMYSLHVRPWAQSFFRDDPGRLAAGLDLLWGNPSVEPDLAYVGFGFMISNFLPGPITNFVMGYSTGGQDCSFSVEAKFLFLTSFQAGFGCGF